jgi:addiction module HigA family antidote
VTSLDFHGAELTSRWWHSQRRTTAGHGIAGIRVSPAEGRPQARLRRDRHRQRADYIGPGRTQRCAASKATRPGELLHENVLPALGVSKADTARLLDVSRQTLHDILDESRSTTPAMALRLGKPCGNGPELWIKHAARLRS